ncbi:hypothetical protein P5G51_005605 [Virgibacillus sp. 179-BFC.A HS]|uniref:Uncharacterized protein n=1 Tax=Tigheibacillus jepli TaxID=3035914 RepID=A0ABU5CF39_9BACI|nr:hypothetical protein [Virgibacillus sp. 179-BFC.A HS]MDY0404944.1 hypothetical protein [Virgibacillus sp. 179-BFC.A HS]
MVTDTNQTRNGNTIVPPFKGYGYLESQVGGAAIKKRVQQELERLPAHPLHNKKDALSVSDIFAFAR